MKMIFGFFDANVSTPAYDPGLLVNCPLCNEPLSRPVCTTSFMRPGDNKSYFYRVHKECDIDADPLAVQTIESAVIDAKELMRLASCNN